MLCACGLPLHYGDATMEAKVQRLCDEYGPDVRVGAGDRFWLVPRHYIALHGLRAFALPSLGFPEVTAPG